MRLVLPTAVCAVAVAFTTAVEAQEPVELPAIIVTGGLTPIRASAIGRAVTVVTAQEIADRGVKYAVDALRNVPGLEVSRTGSFGGLTQVRIRGAEANHTKVFIDGIDVSTPDSGEFDFAGLLAADIERIEVLRGPQSSLFGANALGGVVSIITKQAEREGIEVGGSLDGGTDETIGGSAFARSRSELAALSLSVAARDTGGFDVSDTNGEDDGDENVTLNLRGELYPTDWLTAGGSLRIVDRDSDYDQFNFGAPTRAGLVTDADLVTSRTEIFSSLYADAAAFDGRLEHGPFFSYTRATTTNNTDGRRDSDTTSDRTLFRYRGTVAIDASTIDAANHTLTLATEVQRETFQNNDADLVFDPSQLDEQKRTLLGLVGEYRANLFDALDLQLSLRHDFNDDFEDETTYAAAASYSVAATGTRFHGSIGRGVQNPTMFEQFGFIPGQFNPNPDLKPEESFGWDIGVEQSFLDERIVIDVTYFDQDLDNEIRTLFPPPDFVGTPINEDGKSDRRGVELAGTFRPIDPLSLKLTYTYLDAEDPDGGQEVRRPRHSLGFEATLTFLDGRARVTVDGRYVRDNEDLDFRAPFVAGNRVQLDDYTLVNVTASYALTETFQLFGGVRNLLDEEYEEVFGYATEGITGFAGVRVRW
jgi:vitamin B12 transporter